MSQRKRGDAPLVVMKCRDDWPWCGASLWWWRHWPRNRPCGREPVIADRHEVTHAAALAAALAHLRECKP